MTTINKLNATQAVDYMISFNSYYIMHNDHQRVGQMAYNVLDESVADAIRNTSGDPFYSDRYISAFVQTVFEDECQAIMHAFFAKYL